MSSSPWRDDDDDTFAMMNLVDHCPCLEKDVDILLFRRFLEDSNNNTGGETWQIVYMCVVLALMFVALLSDRVGADFVMVGALTLCMAAKIITIPEGLEGFSNEGLLTVLVLFVVAEGISVTGALDWYMGKLLGRPATVASAQLRLMVPIAIVSAFLNNTPVVAVMIPIVQRWGKNVGISPQQLLIPLSFASILGGTCTLIGTSTNLVVVGLLEARYPNNDSLSNIGLFDLGEYGVPVALAGIAYIIFASPWLLPGAKQGDSSGGQNPLENTDDVLLGARLTPWSPAAGRSVKRSGLRDTGGLYLVSVHRAATGNVHRAVGQDFVLNVGDVLYFTGLVEGFGDFCEEHGLEVMTNEVEQMGNTIQDTEPETITAQGEVTTENGEELHKKEVRFKEEVETESEHFRVPDVVETNTGSVLSDSMLFPVEEQIHEDEHDEEHHEAERFDVGTTKENFLGSDETERLRSINHMQDMIRGSYKKPVDEGGTTPIMTKSRRQRRADLILMATDPPKIVVTEDMRGLKHLVVVGVNAQDRPGLLLDISKGLLSLDLQLHHTEAAVVGDRSISIWRCEALQDQVTDYEEIWSVLSALLESESGVQAMKRRGLRVIRAIVTKQSRLIGRTAAEVDFRQSYKVAIVAVQKGGKNTCQTLSTVRFSANDVLILQASDDSPLLRMPPPDFYKNLADEEKSSVKKSTSGLSLSGLLRFGSSNALSSKVAKDDKNDSTLPDRAPPGDIEANQDEGFFLPDDDSDGERDNGDAVVDIDLTGSGGPVDNDAWRDLQVLFTDEDDAKGVVREFLTAMEVAQKSKLANKTVAQSGIAKLPGVVLVSIERPTANKPEHVERASPYYVPRTSDAASNGGSFKGSLSSLDEGMHEAKLTFVAIAPEEPLMEGDVLWFSGSASAVGDLRKIPGLISFEKDNVEKIKEKVHDRRLVQAVVARKGPLVGKTVVDVKFRTRYGAAVIAIHREGQRVHDHPGQVKLQAGDVLLLEAGPTFISKSADNDKSFALLSEVEDSAPPRLRLLIPALILAAAMLICFTAGLASLLVCALIAAMLMILFGILSQQEARDAINWEVYVTIACAFGIGTALTNSGVAGGVADFLVNIGEAIGLGGAGLYGAVYFATFLISNVVTNNAAAALIFPIAMDAAEKSGASILLMSYTLMLGASASFMSPFGYTTNLLIYGPGGYKYKDFLIIGTPMQLILWILSVAIVSVQAVPWYASWILTSAVLFLVSVTRVSEGTLSRWLMFWRRRS